MEFLLGKPYSRKSTYMQEQALRAAAADSFAPVWYFVPEQYTLQMQRQLLAQNGGKGLLNLEVLSFNRLVYRLQNELPAAGKIALKGSGRAALIYRLLEEGKEHFPVLAAKRKSHAFLQNLAQQITECYQYQMTPERLREAAAQISGELLRDKTAELAELLAAYRAALKQEYFAVEAALEEVCSLLRHAPLEHTEIFVDGFYGFVPIQLEIVSILTKRAKAVHIAFPYAWTDKNRLDLNNLRYPAELYFEIKNSISKLRQDREEERLTLIEETAAGISPELLKIEAELFQNPGLSEENAGEHIHLAEAGTMEEELRYVAEKILFYVYERGYRFRDIAVLTGNLEEYADKAERIFREYRLSFFLDKKETIRRHPVMTFIESALQTVRTDFRYEELMQHLKNTYSALPDWDNEQSERVEEQISRLDIYASEHGLRGSAAYRRLEGLSPELTELLADITELAKGLKQEKGFAGKLAVFQSYLAKRKVFVKLERQAVELERQADWVKASQYRQAGEKLQEYFAELLRFMALPLKEKTGSPQEEEMPAENGADSLISMDDFAALLLAGMSELEYAAAPPVPDQIVVGSLEHTRLPQTRVVFAVGLAESSVPSIQSDHGFFSDWERQVLKKTNAGASLAEDRRTSIFKAQLSIFMSLLSATEDLYLSYATTGASGRAERPASLYYQIRQMFAHNEVKNLTKWWQEHEQVTYPEPTLVSFLKQYHGGGGNPNFLAVYESLKASPLGEVVRRLAEPAYVPAEEIAPVLAERLYAGGRRMSISRLESYYACPFRHFLHYGVKVREIVPYQAERVDMGNFLHKVLEVFFRLSRQQKKSVLALTEKEYEKNLKAAAAEALREDKRKLFDGNARNGFLAERLTEIAGRAVQTMQLQMRRSELSFYQEEVRFRAEDAASLHFFTEEGTEFFLEGKIDRMDISKEGNVVYFSVLDYKTSDHALDYTSIYYGLQLQLLLYLEAGREYLQSRQELTAMPVGAAYFHLKDPVFAQADIAGLPVEQDFLKEMRLKGVFVAEGLARFDREGVEGDKPLMMNVRLKKDGSPYAGDMVLTGEELLRLEEFAHQKAEIAAGRIWQGDAAVFPYYNKKEVPCTYCRYDGICKFDQKERRYRYFSVKEKEDVIGEKNPLANSGKV